MKIYVTLAGVTDLSQSNGDRINEVSMYSAMSKFADVYYNNQKIDFSLPNFGVDPKRPVTPPDKKYDFHYIRHNPDILHKINGPKACLATPYNESCYKEADAVVVYTESWKSLMDGKKDPVVPGLSKSKIFPPKKVILFDQVIPDNFKPLKGHPKTKQYRKRFGGDFIIGNFGRLSQGTYPHSLLVVIKKLQSEFPGVKIKFFHAGKNKGVKTKFDSIGLIKYSDMPFAVSACDIVTCNSRQDTANWAGCKDVLEGMACGIPVLTGDYSVRKEQFGENYELFWPHKLPNNGRISDEAESVMLNILRKAVSDPKSLDRVSKKIIYRSKYYRADNVAKRMESEIISVIDSCRNK